MIEFTHFLQKINLVMICTPNSFKTTAISEEIINDFTSGFKKLSTHIYNDINIEKGS
jgi:hypothetical protein